MFYYIVVFGSDTLCQIHGGTSFQDFMAKPEYAAFRDQQYDCVISDQPFNCQLDQNGEIIAEDFIDLMKEPLEKAKLWNRVLGDNGYVVIRCGDFQHLYWSMALRAAGFQVEKRLFHMVRDQKYCGGRKDVWGTRVNSVM
jgi:hypothetical protein